MNGYLNKTQLLDMIRTVRTEWQALLAEIREAWMTEPGVVVTPNRFEHGWNSRRQLSQVDRETSSCEFAAMGFVDEYHPPLPTPYNA